MYKVRKEFIGTSIHNTKTGKVVFLNEKTTQEELRYLNEKKHPAVYFVRNKKNDEKPVEENDNE